MMDRFKGAGRLPRSPHTFRHTFATVATQGGWNLERLRVAKGRWDHSALKRYVELSVQRDLGSLKERGQQLG